MTFADIHCHALCHVDDGAKDMEMTGAMIDAAYQDGVRYLCLTPHYHPGYYGYNEERASQSFVEARKYAAKYPDLQLSLANELHYAPESLSWIRQRLCRVMGDSRYVLVDFRKGEAEGVIVDGLTRILGGGYHPILAHAERYEGLRLTTLKLLKQDGILVQVNTGAVLGDFGWSVGRRAKRMLSQRMVDFMSTDAHDLVKRPPNFSKAYEYIEKKCGTEYARSICRDRAVDLFFGHTPEYPNASCEVNQKNEV